MTDKSMYSALESGISTYIESRFMKNIAEADAHELESAIGYTVMNLYAGRRAHMMKPEKGKRRAYYLSCEFLLGRQIFNNLLSLGIYEDIKKIISDNGGCFDKLSEIEDPGLGNGGLGRLAACYMDSAATLGLPLCGYGIRYKCGIFRQQINFNGQSEFPDDWTRFGDCWSIPVYSDRVTVDFDDFSVIALPYDTPIFGYRNNSAANLRLWEAEPCSPFDFGKFNSQKYDDSLRLKNEAENISRVLYPADDTEDGKKLRLRQQYFFASASLKDVLRRYKISYPGDFTHFAEENIFQLNDTHPVIAIPELIRLLMNEGLTFEQAFDIARKCFAYTNHTIMSEALESWSLDLISSILAPICKIIKLIDSKILSETEFANNDNEKMQIIQDGRVRMANLALHMSYRVNGVAKLHTEILKEKLFSDYERRYPDKLINITNGITQRRWLALANPQLASLVSRLCGETWITDLTLISKVGEYIRDISVIDDFVKLKRERRLILSEHIRKHEGAVLNPDAVFDVQIKRIHEYKRQLLNALSLLALCIEYKSGLEFNLVPSAFIFGGKAAPGYRQAKNIIALICAIEKLIREDKALSRIISVHFVENYNVSYAELLCSAADISEQISCAGFEASGTGNMKMMLNGALTLGTLDGANVEIVNEVGRENCYIFGSTVEELADLKNSYDNVKETIIKHDPLLCEALKSMKLICDKNGYPELYDSLVSENGDTYFVIKDFASYYETKKRALADFENRTKVGSRGLANIAGSAMFSSDRAVREYADKVWKIQQ